MGPPVGTPDNEPVTVDQDVLECGPEIRKGGPEVRDRPAVLTRPHDPHVGGVVADEVRGEERLGLADVALVPDLIEEATYGRPQFVVRHFRLPDSRRQPSANARVASTR